MRYLLLFVLFAGVTCAQRQEAARKTHYDFDNSVLSWDVHQFVNGKVGKKLMSCRVDFKSLLMTCGKASYPFTRQEAEFVEGTLGHFIGHYIAESMDWFYQGGKPPAPPAPPGDRL